MKHGPTVKTPVSSAPEGLFHRAGITLACLAAFILAQRGRVPGVLFDHGLKRQGIGPAVDSRPLEALFLDHSLGRMCFGLLVAGILSRVLSRRFKLDPSRAAWWISCALSFGINWVAGVGPNGYLVNTSLDGRHLAGLFAVFGLSAMITRQGILNGLSALLGAWSLDAFYTVFLRASLGLEEGSLTPLSVLVWSLALGAIIALTARTLSADTGMRARRVNAETSSDTAYRASSASDLEVVPALKTPASAGDAMMVFPFFSLGVVLVAELLGLELPEWLLGDPRNPVYCAVYLTITLGCVVGFNHLLSPAEEVARAIAQATGIDASQAQVNACRAALHAAIARSALFVTALTLLGWLQEVLTLGALGDSARIAMILTAVVLDAVASMRLAPSMTSVRAETRVYVADLMRALLAAYDIPAVITGQGYRTLQPFLGALGSIHVAVDSTRSDEALDALAAARTPSRRVSNADLN